MVMMRNGLAGFAVVLATLTLSAPVVAQGLDDELEFDEWDAQVCHTAYARAELALFPAENTAINNRMTALAIQYPFVPLFPEAPKGDAAKRELAATLQYCEEMLQFQPPIDFASYLLPAQPASQYPTDLECAAAYWLHGAAKPDEQQGAMERAQFALGKHHEANPQLDPATLGSQVIAQGQARGQRIQQGQESVDGLAADLAACEAKYGHAPVKVQ